MKPWYIKNLWLEILRTRMENLVERHGLSDHRVLAISKRVDKLVNELQRWELNANSTQQS